MNPGAIWIAIIAAAVGGLVSTVISEIGRWHERKSRREELALGKAVEMAQARVETAKEIYKESGKPVRVPPEVLMAQEYYISLKHLLDKGKLDPGMWSRIETSMREVGVDLNKRYEKKDREGGPRED